MGDAFQRFDLGITAFGKAIGSVVIKVIQNGLAPML
jgi:hypothetical protein